MMDRKVFGPVLLTVSVLSIVACHFFSFFPATTQSDHRTLVIGHRGAAGLAPENTLAAIQVGIDLGVDAVEFDIQRSADGELVVIHDEDVDRTTDGTGLVIHKTLAELKALDAGSWFGEAYIGETIPSLRDVFDLVQTNDVLLFIELKSPALYDGIEEDLVALIHEYGYAKRVSILSFDYQSLQRVHALAPELERSGLWSRQLPKIDEAVFDVVNARFSLYQGRPRSIEDYQQAGLKVMAWTVDESADMEWLLARNIDGITTNYPDELLKILER